MTVITVLTAMVIIIVTVALMITIVLVSVSGEMLVALRMY